jgi:hypothetical protein
VAFKRYRTLLLSRYRARFVLYRQIEDAADRETRPLALLRLAEALAWVSEPDQPHGGTAIVGISGGDGDDGDGDGGDGGE